jgi:hypothetical protein
MTQSDTGNRRILKGSVAPVETVRAAGMALLLALGVPAAGMVASSFAAAQDAFIPLRSGWHTYVNSRFGMSFDYPSDIFTPAEPAENGDGQTFESSDATLQIFATHNALNDSPSSMKREMVGMTDYENVTYSPSGDTWLVLSGFRGDRIFYEKYFFRRGVISAFAIEFPAGRKPHYAPIIERIEDSFRPGSAG